MGMRTCRTAEHAALVLRVKNAANPTRTVFPRSRRSPSRAALLRALKRPKGSTEGHVPNRENPRPRGAQAVMFQAVQYRFNFTAVRNVPSPADAIQLSEIRLYAPDGQRYYLSAQHGAVNPMGNNPFTQGPLNLLDDSLHTKWCVTI